LDAAKSGTWEWDLRDNENKWSDEIWNLYGLEPYSCEPSYDSWLATVHPEDRETAQQQVKQAVESGTELNLEYRLSDRSRGVRWIAGRGRPLFDVKGNAISYIGIAMDITEDKRIEQALIRSEKLASVGRMAATVAHEVNNPLEAATNCVYIALSNPKLDPELKQHLKTAQRELQRVAHVTKQALGFYRENLKPSIVDIRTLVEEVVELYTPRFQSKGIDHSIEHDACCVEVVAVAGEIRQVIANLLVNAVDASTPKGIVKIRISRVRLNGSVYTRVTVADTGPGIPPTIRNRVFEPFFTTKETFGTGLGLWVSQQVVKKHHGRIRLRSAVGKGTAFSVFLPHVQPEHSRTG
jgi:PAS domain S-box-containing protein